MTLYLTPIFVYKYVCMYLWHNNVTFLNRNDLSFDVMSSDILCMTWTLVLCRSNRKNFLEGQLGGIHGQLAANEDSSE
jgi:hypothetical protein